ncbi:MAG TPA: hypothetical protein VGR52_10995 [Stellaceae bacterium]|nr:hypothetical protein [Stellaceae bacterium]
MLAPRRPAQARPFVSAVDAALVAEARIQRGFFFEHLSMMGGMLVVWRSRRIVKSG